MHSVRTKATLYLLQPNLLSWTFLCLSFASKVKAAAKYVDVPVSIISPSFLKMSYFLIWTCLHNLFLSKRNIAQNESWHWGGSYCSRFVINLTFHLVPPLCVRAFKVEAACGANYCHSCLMKTFWSDSPRCRSWMVTTRHGNTNEWQRHGREQELYISRQKNDKQRWGRPPITKRETQQHILKDMHITPTLQWSGIVKLK